MSNLYYLYSSTNLQKESLRKLGEVDIVLEQLKPFSYIAYHEYCTGMTMENSDKTQNQIISKAWSNLIQWQMNYEFRKQYGLEQKLPSKTSLGRFMIENKLHVMPNAKYFGSIKPFPYKEDEFGYEACAVLKDFSMETAERIKDDAIQIKNCQGGLYATAYATYGKKYNLNKVWKYMHLWLSENPQYTYGEQDWFEEHITIPEKGRFHGFRLYMPIKNLT